MGKMVGEDGSDTVFPWEENVQVKGVMLNKEITDLLLLLLLLLLCSQLYLWGSPFWVRFLRMLPFFNPSIEVVIFHLR